MLPFLLRGALRGRLPLLTMLGLLPVLNLSLLHALLLLLGLLVILLGLLPVGLL